MDQAKWHLDRDTLNRIRVQPNSRILLKNYDTSWVRDVELEHNDASRFKQESKDAIYENILTLTHAQEIFYTCNSHGILIILQGMDASGKDGIIKHVMSGINPQGCQVHSFKEPTLDELRHHFLWRYIKATPARGHISIFNRSHYEEVVTVRIHPEWLDRQQVPQGTRTSLFWKQRYEDINALERSLTRNGIMVLKFFLHISKDEQKNRLLARLSDKEKYWKFSPSDVKERTFWQDYQRYYAEAISATSMDWAPWYVIPADSKRTARALIADVISHSIHSLRLTIPRHNNDLKKNLAAFKRTLEQER